jgi:glutathione S-transferase
MIDAQVRRNEFFLGKNFTMADASMYHPFFFLALNPNHFAIATEKHPNLRRWYERVRDLS